MNAEFQAPQNETQESHQTRTLALAWKGMTVEPFVFLLLFGSCITNVTTITLMMSKVCLVEQNYPSSICDNIISDEHLNEKLIVQKSANNWLMIENIVQTLPSVIASLFIGPWSDKYGRKVPMLVLATGYLLSTAGMIAVSLFPGFPPYTIVMCSIPTAVCCSLALLMLVMSYVADTSTVASRTVKFTVITMIIVVGATAGQIVGGYIQKKYGFFVVYASALSCEILALFSGIVWIKESRGLQNTDCWKVRLKYFFDISTVQESFRAFFKPRPMAKRTGIVLLTSSILLYVIYEGYSRVMFQYTQLKFDWTEWQFSLFQSISGFIWVMSSMLIVLVCQRYFQTSDYILGALSSLSFIVGAIVVGLAQNVYTLYLGYSFAIMKYILPPIARSGLTKLVGNDEVGKVFAMVSVAESLMPLITSVLYPEIYNATASTFPSCFMFASALVAVLPLSFFLCLSVMSERWRTSDASDINQTAGIGYDVLNNEDPVV